MMERVWPLSVRDARARVHAGIVIYAERAPALQPLRPEHEFRIVLLAAPQRVKLAAEATAVCVPGAPVVRAAGPLAPLHLPEEIEALTLPPQRMAAYAAGTIFMAGPPLVAAADIFPAHADHPRLDRLALALVEITLAEEAALYTALVRHVLALAPGVDPVFELEERLRPPDVSERPPGKAPGIVRLKAAAAALRKRRAPDTSLEQFEEDLRLLRLFARGDAWPQEAMGRLLRDVQPPPRKKPSAKAADPRITPLRRPMEDP